MEWVPYYRGKPKKLVKLKEFIYLENDTEQIIEVHGMPNLKLLIFFIINKSHLISSTCILPGIYKEPLNPLTQPLWSPVCICGRPPPAPHRGPSCMVRLLWFFHSVRQKHLANGWAWRAEETQVTVKNINHNLKVKPAPLKRFYYPVTMPGPGEPPIRQLAP